MTKLTGIIMSENKLTGSLGVRNEINVSIRGTGPRGLQGSDGYTPIKGIDYFDGSDANVTNTNVVNALGYIPLSEDSLPSNLETTTGSQDKANQAEQNAKDYTDQEISSIDIPDSTWESIQNKPDTFVPSEHNHTIGNITDLQNELNSKETPSGSQSKANVAESNAKSYVDGKVLTDVPINAKFTDTVYSHPSSHPASMITDLPTGKKVARFVVGTSTAGWTDADVDYLCDGTEDQTEINAAITALPATGGEIIILDGTYNITAKIDVTKNNVSIRGNGNATTLKRMFDSSVKEGVITLTDRSGCKIANLQVDGNKTSYTSRNNYGICLDASNNSIITDSICYNNTIHGIYLNSSNNNTIARNTGYDNHYGIYLRSSSSNTVTSNTCNNNNECGIYLSASSSNTVTDNTCYNNSNYSIYLGASSSNTVTGNTCNKSNYAISLSSSSDNTITGNSCNNSNCGIRLDSSIKNVIVGNTCNNNSFGIYLRNSSSNNTITSNTCVRGTGLATDYLDRQHTILVEGTSNNYNLIAMNNCMGKAVTNEGGTGNTLVTGEKGEKGTDGKDGYTPQKGVDYYTDADKAEMVSIVLSALPVYEGEVESV